MRLFCSLVLINILYLVDAFLTEDTSCSGRCNAGYDRTKPCQCNTQCVSFNNCCNDHNTQCVSVRSCGGRCSTPYTPSLPCQCNSQCTRYNNCCNDYNTTCTGTGRTCTGRCSTPYTPSLPCQCNSQCSRYNNCCDDYNTACTGTDVCGLTLTQLSEQLWTQDTPDRLTTTEIDVDPQAFASGGDMAARALFSRVDPVKLRRTIYSTFLTLVNNYSPAKFQREVSTSGEVEEQNNFLNALLNTSTIETLYQYLVCKGKVSSRSDFRSTLHRLWFEHFPRSPSSNTPDTSGFEHIMVGEYKDSIQVGGMHSWLVFYEMERTGQFNYYGRKADITNDAAKISFSWDGRIKYTTSMFIRSSPAFDVAIYTVCFLLHPGQQCAVKVGGHDYSIRTYTRNFNSADYIATVFLEL